MKEINQFSLISTAVEMTSAQGSDCPEGQPMVSCFIDPCVSAEAAGCPGYPGANCV